MAPFLTFYTPTYKRPTLLKHNQSMIKAQNCNDWEQVVIVDEVGLGIPGMFADVPNHLDKVTGQYVYFHQDDDVLTDADVVGDLKRAAQGANNPPLIMVKNTKHHGRTLPMNWGKAPQYKMIDLGNYVVRADVFKANAQHFGRRYAGDYDFIAWVWHEHGKRALWFDRLIARAQTIGLGRPESELI